MRDYPPVSTSRNLVADDQGSRTLAPELLRTYACTVTTMSAVVHCLVARGRLRLVKASIRGRHTLASILRLQHSRALNLLGRQKGS
jgi:hypothetical protein